MKSNDNPVALVTGGARRVGAIIAKTLHQHGYNIVIHYRKSAASAERVSAGLNALRPQSAITLQADFNDFKTLQPLIQIAVKQWQRLDVLVNNASDFFPTDVQSTNEQDWNGLLNSNLKAPFFLASYAAPFLKKQGGTIINITDIHGQKPLKDYSIYSIAKAGLTMLTQSLAKELAPDIRVNAIAPGPTLWPENESELNTSQKTKIISKTPLQRMVNPHDIAHSVVFLVKQSSITGQVLNVDCGRSLSL